MTMLENDTWYKHRCIMYAIQIEFSHCEVKKDYIMMVSFRKWVSRYIFFEAGVCYWIQKNRVHAK